MMKRLTATVGVVGTIFLGAGAENARCNVT